MLLSFLLGKKNLIGIIEIFQVIRMKKKKRKSNRNLAKLAIGLKNVWGIKLPVFKFLIVWALHHVFLYLGSSVGQQTWNGRGSPSADAKWHWCDLIICSGLNWYSCRLMKSQTMGDTTSLEYMRGRRVFEINPEHPIIKNLNVRWTRNTALPFVTIYWHL